MTEALTDPHILDAIGMHLGRTNDAERRRLADTAVITHIPVLDCRITRSVESTREKERSCPGSVDLSDRPAYDDLRRHRVEPPVDPGIHQKTELVKRGSRRVETCGCGNGSVSCARCSGQGQVPCEPYAICADCRDSTPCVACHGTGDTGTRPAHLRSDVPLINRVTCDKCDRRSAACSACRGAGRRTCGTCRGKGVVRCKNCDGKGTVDHDACAGTGRITRWTAGVVEHSARKERIRLPVPRPPFLARRRMDRTGTWHKAELTGRDRLPADLARTHREALSPRLDRHEGEVARSIRIRHLALARVELEDDSGRVFFVFPGHSGAEVVDLPSRQRVSRLATIAAACLATVLVVALLVGQR